MGQKGPVLGLGASGPEGLEPKYHSFMMTMMIIVAHSLYL